MGFYNDQPNVDAPTWVAPWTPPGAGQSLRPLDVVPYGGLGAVHGNLAGAGNQQILAAPSAGTVWRLHRVTFTIFAGTASAELFDSVTGFLFCIFNGGGSGLIGIDLAGQLAPNGVGFLMNGAGAQCWLFSDAVTNPNIK